MLHDIYMQAKMGDLIHCNIAHLHIDINKLVNAYDNHTMIVPIRKKRIDIRKSPKFNA